MILYVPWLKTIHYFCLAHYVHVSDPWYDHSDELFYCSRTVRSIGAEKPKLLATDGGSRVLSDKYTGVDLALKKKKKTNLVWK